MSFYFNVTYKLLLCYFGLKKEHLILFVYSGYVCMGEPMDGVARYGRATLCKPTSASDKRILQGFVPLSAFQ